VKTELEAEKVSSSLAMAKKRADAASAQVREFVDYKTSMIKD